MTREVEIRRLRVAVIGAGNFGSSLIAALRNAGVAVEVVRRGGWRRARLDARVIWICVPDAAIASVAAQIVALRRDLRGRTVVHASGALSASVLESARLAGARVASLHPVMSFPGRRVVSLRGVMFGVEAQDAVARRELSALVRRLGGEPFAVKAEAKALYHAAGVLASPLLTAELAAAMEAARGAGLSKKAAAAWVKALAEATAANVFAHGPERSFSGPFARGDAETIPLHLQALQAHPILADVYRSLARYAIARLPVKRRRDLERAMGKTRGVK